MNHLPQIRPEIPIAVRTANRCALAIASSPTRKRNVLYLVRSRWSSELAKALATAKRRGGILVISTISRLGRRVSFVARLMEQKDVPFTCADAPDDEPFILHVKAAFAEEEARKIIARTKAALAVAKARGKKLGTPANLTDDARRRGAEANAARGRGKL